MSVTRVSQAQGTLVFLGEGKTDFPYGPMVKGFACRTYSGSRSPSIAPQRMNNGKGICTLKGILERPIGATWRLWLLLSSLSFLYCGSCACGCPCGWSIKSTRIRSRNIFLTLFALLSRVVRINSLQQLWNKNRILQLGPCILELKPFAASFLPTIQRS